MKKRKIFTLRGEYGTFTKNLTRSQYMVVTHDYDNIIKILHICGTKPLAINWLAAIIETPEVKEVIKKFQDLDNGEGFCKITSRGVMSSDIFFKSSYKLKGEDIITKKHLLIHVTEHGKIDGDLHYLTAQELVELANYFGIETLEARKECLEESKTQYYNCEELDSSYHTPSKIEL